MTHRTLFLSSPVTAAARRLAEFAILVHNVRPLLMDELKDETAHGIVGADVVPSSTGDIASRCGLPYSSLSDLEFRIAEIESLAVLSGRCV